MFNDNPAFTWTLLQKCQKCSHLLFWTVHDIVLFHGEKWYTDKVRGEFRSPNNLSWTLASPPLSADTILAAEIVTWKFVPCTSCGKPRFITRWPLYCPTGLVNEIAKNSCHLRSLACRSLKWFPNSLGVTRTFCHKDSWISTLHAPSVLKIVGFNSLLCICHCFMKISQ